MLRVLLIAALATCALGRERYEGWVKPDKPLNVDPLIWGGCGVDCGVGTKYESTREWTIACNTYPCASNLSCQCGNSDFLFVVDNTGSITQKRFFEAKQFVMDMMEGLSRYGGDMLMSRVGMVTFENYSYVEFDFNDGNTLSDVATLKDNIWEVEKQNGFTNTSGALWMAGQIFKTQQSSNKKILIFLSDGQANIDEHLIAHYAQELKDAGIGVFVLGVGYVIDEVELKMIASDPDEEFYFFSESFSGLQDIIDEMMEGACCTVPPPSCEVHSETGCSATCDGGSYDKVSTCFHFGFGGVIVLTETVTETFPCNTTPCPATVTCTHNGNTLQVADTWERTCTCTLDGTNVCEDDEYDTHQDDRGETSPTLGCRWAKVWHPPGSQWIQDVSGNRQKNCSCSDPPPYKFHVWNHCEAICHYDDTWYNGGDTFTFVDTDDNTIECTCKTFAKLSCIVKSLANDRPTDPVLGCKWKTVWHAPGTTWTEYVSGGRMKHCECTDPPPEYWNIDVDCIGKCLFENVVYYYPESVEWTDPSNGVLKLCRCTSSAQMQCSRI